MNPLTPGPPPPMPAPHQSYHQNYYQPPPPPPPPPIVPPVHHGQPPVAQPCFNCGATSHWAQQCPEPRRNVPAGAVQQKPRNRGSKSGPGPIITRYPPPSTYYPYPAPPQAQSPVGPPYQQPYGSPYGALPAPPAPAPAPPPPHPMPPQQGPGQHYGVPPPPPPPPPPPSSYPQYPGPHTPQYSHHPPYSPGAYPPQSHPPPVPPPHHQQTPYYPPNDRGYRAPPPPPAPYQFYNQPTTPTQPYPIPSQRPPNHQGRHRQHSVNQQHPPAQQRNSVSESSGPVSGGGPIIWRPAQRVERPLAPTFEESEQAEEQGLTGPENANGTISKYWNPNGKRTKVHPKLADLADDPALQSVKGKRCRVIESDFIDEDDAGRDDVEMELANSDDGKPDVMDKLSGVLSRQSSEPRSDFRAPLDDDFGRRRSIKYENRRTSRDESRRSSRDVGGQSPRRGRSKSPSFEDSTYGSYRSRTPSGGAAIRKNRTQHPLPAKPDTVVDATPPKATDRFSVPSTDYSPIKIKEERNGRSRSASPNRRDSEDGNRRHRDYDIRSGDAEKGKNSKDKKRRTSGTNGVPAVFGRRW